MYEIKRKLILNGYIIKHKPNIANNLYFDVDDRSFVENIEGERRIRKKIRLRWYGDFHEIKNPTLEFKIKNEILERKIDLKLNQFLIWKI